MLCEHLYVHWGYFVKNKLFLVLCALCLVFSFVACQKEEKEKNDSKAENFNEIKAKEGEKSINIAVFLPGVRAESAIYDMLATGVEEAVEEGKKSGKNVSLTILEAGTNQSQWVEKMSNLASEGKYDILISSNPSMPSIAKEVLEKFPNNKFLLLDSYCDDEKRITTAKYNQYEQAYIAGHMAALVSTSGMKYAKKTKKIGLISGQEYPDMTNIILPSFTKGAKDVDADIEVDFRIVGNWYDASKGAELANSMYNEGVDVIMPICGGANQGAIASAKENGFYLVWFDSNGYSKAEGYVVGSATLEQQRCAYEKTLSFINGSLKEGTAEILGMKEGYIKFVGDDPIYISTVPSDLREKQENMLKRIESGELVLSKD